MLKELLEAEPPLVSCADRILSPASGLHSSISASNIVADQGMQVTYNLKKAGAGWEAPAVAPWLEIAAENASNKVWLPDSPDSRTNVGQLMYVMIMMCVRRHSGSPRATWARAAASPSWAVSAATLPHRAVVFCLQLSSARVGRVGCGAWGGSWRL